MVSHQTISGIQKEKNTNFSAHAAQAISKACHIHKAGLKPNLKVFRTEKQCDTHAIEYQITVSKKLTENDLVYNLTT